MARALLFWAVLIVVSAVVFFALVGAPSATVPWMMRIAGLLVMAGAASILYGSRGTGQRKPQVLGVTLLAYGASQFIPAVGIRAILMIPILLAMFAAMAGVPASFFRNGTSSTK